MKLTSSVPSPPYSRIWLVLAWVGIVVGVVVRFAWLGKKSLWFDEGYTAWMVSHPPHELMRLIRADTAPPFYYLLLRGWTVMFGTSEFALRSLSTIFSVATLFLVAKVARKLLPLPAAVGAIWLVSLGFHQEFYAQEARVYALMGLLTVAALDFLLIHLSSQGRGWLIPLTFLAAMALYSHNAMAFYLVAMVAAWMILPSTHSMARRLTDAAIVAIGAFILYLPWMITSLAAQMHLVRVGFWAERPTLRATLVIISWIAGIPRPEDWNGLIYWLHSPHALGDFPAWFGLIIIVLCTIVGLWLLRGQALREFLALLALLLIPPAMVLVYSLLSRPILMDKMFFPSTTLMPIFLLFPLGAISAIAWRRIAAVGVFFLLFVQAAALVDYFAVPYKEQWRLAAQMVADLPAQRRLFVFVANDGELPFDYYYHYRPGEAVTGAPSGFFDRDPPRTMLRVMAPADMRSVEARIEGEQYDHVVVVLSHWLWADPTGYSLRSMAKRFPHETHRDFYDVSIYCYDK